MVRHAPTLNGKVEGSIHQMTAENVTFNGGARVTGDLFVPGTPTVRLNGSPAYGGTQDGTGSATPTNHTITLNGNASLGHVVRRTDAIALPAVSTPPQPAGTRSVSLNNSSQSPGNFATLKNLTLNSNVGPITVPPGTYGNFNANSGSGFVLGVAGATTPAVYHFQNLTLNSNSSFTVVGPVVVTVDGGFSTNTTMGSADHPEWLRLRIAGGGLSLASNRTVYAHLEAPEGTLTLNGGSRLIGAVTADRLIVNGNSLLQLIAPAAANQPPTVALTAPVAGSSFPAPAGFTLAATAADSDGTVARVEFFQGETKLGEDTTAPYAQAVGGLAAGAYSFSARAVDNRGATTNSAAVSITVVAPANQPPSVALTAPTDGSTFTLPLTLTLSATASDADGTIARVEFYQGGSKVGEDTVAPYQFATGSLSAGSYIFTARAFDNLGASTTSAGVRVTVTAANQPSTAALTAPVNGAAFTAPAGFTLAATAADSDGSITKVEFYRDGTRLGEDALAPYEFAVSGLAAGTHHFIARATDDGGLATDSPAITVTVTAPNLPPSVALTAPADGATFTLPLTLTLSAVAADSDGTVAKVEFFTGTTKLGEVLAPSTPPATFTLTIPLTLPGTYGLTARATDNAGSSTISDPVTVVVTDNGVPFLANFEPAEDYQPGPLSGQRGWIVDGSVSIVSSPVYAGLQAVSVAPATPPALLVRAFVNADPSVTFVDFFAQPAAAATPAAGVFFETEATRVALTGTSSSGNLQVFSGDGAGGGTWLPTGAGPVLDASGRVADWLRLTTRADYTGKTWDLYLNGRMIAANLGFIDNTQPAFTGLGLSGHATLVTGFDDLLVGFENPLFADADHDGMDDAWETAHGLNPALNDRDADRDQDGLSNLQEYVLGTSADSADTDADGLGDLEERTLGTNPSHPDTDEDGLPDGWENTHGLNPLLAADASTDADKDGVSNLAEFAAGTDPADFYNGILPRLMSQVSPDGVLGINGSLSILVTNASGTPLVDAPVKCMATTGGHKLSATPDGPATTETTVFSNAVGLVTIYVRGGGN
ncbi:MAG: Ig-like domain-containing protein [Lacunisphaera sp.]|nr:Ig-like domain-containing protein [Lacunisphaera sp.]